MAACLRKALCWNRLESPFAFAMRFSRIYLNRLQNQPLVSDAVVVIDVLRSFTTAAVALSRGARALFPVEGVAAAIALAGKVPNSLLVGAVAGGDPAPGFDFGNSPSELMAADLNGKNIVMSTAAGVRGLQRFRGVRHLFAGSLVCARATAEAIRTAGSRNVCFVITGDWVDRDGDEDIACADYLQSLLSGEKPDSAPFSRRVRESDFARRFGTDAWPNLPAADLELAAQADLFDFAMLVHYSGDYLVIR
jgi:2-phosphosulfolactate phosphatase